ncbi:hypothetical protein MAC_08452 [Metarhizium acridum CQMa 102]|uniref:F-box domain-containing protein n=1 Tax=Metarhizium acridum (strain CQMa 102) TaxID=655827 RepID=E9EF04_METAQ|nr:uncharacterized protein MAC_08452 [Metarhizium acridum CQMa 102]EFY85505.1 hypothetical protein MAC_08452 [Metarhizium acridum CQMa 102]
MDSICQPLGKGDANVVSNRQQYILALRTLVVESLLQDACDLAGFATVSREWKSIIEPHNFARIKLTPSRLAGFESIAHRHRARVRYIWFCLKLLEYDCIECVPSIRDMEGLGNSDNVQITTAFQPLFSTLSTWEPHGTLLLDTSLHSPATRSTGSNI